MPPAARVAQRARLLAPLWHTRVLVGLMLVVALTGAIVAQVAQTSRAVTSPIASLYLPLTIVNLGLCAYVCRVGLERSLFAQLFSQGRYDGRRLLADLAWAGAFTFALIRAENGLQLAFGLPESAAAHALVPITAGEKSVWALVAALVGFSEELVFRGYLQRQLAALSGSVLFGVAAQALLFGIAHGEQGAATVARFAVYAFAFGWLSVARKSLMPCVLAHVAIDWCAGLAG